MELVGRKIEQKTFKHCQQSTESKLVAVYGRRRVGKTFMIRSYFNQQFTFEITGLHNGELHDQLTHFSNTLVAHNYLPALNAIAQNWMAAFGQLQLYLDTKKGKGKKVIFIDELPWFDTPRSKFLTAFEHFWNNYCTKRNDILFIICGSAASWMIKKVLKNKGGLHNRVSERIQLLPFNLDETEQFLRNKNIKWSKYDITQLYMSVGGIPFYLDAIRKGESVAQFIDRTCFQKNGLLKGEYKQLFSSLFKKSEQHEKVIEILAGNKQGLERSDIITQGKFSSGGGLSSILEELEESGFIESLAPYQSKRTKLKYRLIDQYSLFYLKFINASQYKESNWLTISNSQTWKSWSGIAFERICFYHRLQIQKALGIDKIKNQISSWSTKDVTRGAQIDLLIDRADRIINICEIKFLKADYTITKEEAKKLRNRIEQFSNLTVNKRKTILLTIISTYGTSDNEYSKELVQSEIVLEDLFKD